MKKNWLKIALLTFLIPLFFPFLSAKAETVFSTSTTIDYKTSSGSAKSEVEFSVYSITYELEKYPSKANETQAEKKERFIADILAGKINYNQLIRVGVMEKTKNGKSSIKINGEGTFLFLQTNSTDGKIAQPLIVTFPKKDANGRILTEVTLYPKESTSNIGPIPPVTPPKAEEESTEKDSTYSDTAPNGIIFFYKYGRTASNENQGPIKDAKFILMKTVSGATRYFTSSGKWSTSEKEVNYFVSDKDGLVTTAGMTIADGSYKLQEVDIGNDYYVLPKTSDAMSVTVAGETITIGAYNIRKNVIYWNYPTESGDRTPDTFENAGLTPPANGEGGNSLPDTLGEAIRGVLPDTGEEVGSSLFWEGLVLIGVVFLVIVKRKVKKN
ncbi:MAG: LPXTG cell wall anchor domain-containing protein [Lactobacillales bacterium]|nr:LPXTG cell wall anchor domain-containing protein [Lactobacillales bacterium]